MRTHSKLSGRGQSTVTQIAASTELMPSTTDTAMRRVGSVPNVCESNSRDPAFAVVLPSFNRETKIARALESILSQSAQPAEIIVVDDGSDDRTREIVQTFGSVVSLVSQTNRGASAARNVGLHLARSEWVAFLDSDDYWFSDHPERLPIAIRETGGAADVYFANMQRGEPPTTLWERAESCVDSLTRSS
jgi:glycosyltransferase involved in cell wall biosynthesis